MSRDWKYESLVDTWLIPTVSYSFIIRDKFESLIGEKLNKGACTIFFVVVYFENWIDYDYYWVCLVFSMLIAPDCDSRPSVYRSIGSFISYFQNISIFLRDISYQGDEDIQIFLRDVISFLDLFMIDEAGFHKLLNKIIENTAGIFVPKLDFLFNDNIIESTEIKLRNINESVIPIEKEGRIHMLFQTVPEISQEVIQLKVAKYKEIINNCKTIPNLGVLEGKSFSIAGVGGREKSFKQMKMTRHKKLFKGIIDVSRELPFVCKIGDNSCDECEEEDSRLLDVQPVKMTPGEDGVLNVDDGKIYFIDSEGNSYPCSNDCGEQYFYNNIGTLCVVDDGPDPLSTMSGIRMEMEPSGILFSKMYFRDKSGFTSIKLCNISGKTVPYKIFTVGPYVDPVKCGQVDPYLFKIENFNIWSYLLIMVDCPHEIQVIWDDNLFDDDEKDDETCYDLC